MPIDTSTFHSHEPHSFLLARMASKISFAGDGCHRFRSDYCSPRSIYMLSCLPFSYSESSRFSLTPPREGCRDHSRPLHTTLFPDSSCGNGTMFAIHRKDCTESLAMDGGSS